MRCRVAALIALLVIIPGRSAGAQSATPAAPPGEVPQATDTRATHPLARWFEAQALAVSTRYDYIENGLGDTLQNRLQTQAQIRARLKLDAAGRYSVHAGVFTGNAFTSGWNSTGIGTGDGSATLYLKHLFVAAEPLEGLELQYGSVTPERGQSTEITTYDNDAYLAAGRVSVRRPATLFFEDVTVSIGYIGYLDTPFVFDRTGAFSRHNYWQVVASKEVVPGLSVSTDYSVLEDAGTLRQGATWRIDRPWIDAIAGEYAIGLRGGSHPTAFALRGEKKIAVVDVEAGYANVDAVFGLLNGDAYRAGKRVFASGSFPLPFDLSASWFVQKEIAPAVTSLNRARVDLVLRWGVLKTLQRAGVVPAGKSHAARR